MKLKFLLMLIICGLILGGCHRRSSINNMKDFMPNTAGEEKIIYLYGDTVGSFAEILVDNGIIASVSKFNTLAANKIVYQGYYKLPSHIPASLALEMVLDKDYSYRVGRVIIPEGSILTTKNTNNSKPLPGIFARISKATKINLNGRVNYISESELISAAENLTITDFPNLQGLNLPFAKLGADFRKIEGLIMPGTWDDINPFDTAKNILIFMITKTLHNYKNIIANSTLTNYITGLGFYEKLIVASIVEHEVNNPIYYNKVARVIYNRLLNNMPLQMDSTVNYTAEISNINLTETEISNETLWNTYTLSKLPITPIGAISEPALKASLNPEFGDWLFFVTVDNQGTTLFSKTLTEHQKNINIACKNKFLFYGCNF